MLLPKRKEITSRFFNNKKKCLLISYYWGKNNINKGSIYQLTYGEQVERIVKDCTRHKINYFFVEYPDLEKENYQYALSLKSHFVKYCLKKFPDYNCIFVDTDLRILQYPHIFEMEADCWFLNWNEFDFECYNPLQLELPGGIFGFSNTNISNTILDILIKNQKPQYAEDKTFSGIITKNYLNIFARCVWLPSNYLYMFETHTYRPNIGYTKVSDYNKELKGTLLKKSDLVFVHEDFETGVLDDIFKKRVKKNRYPPNLDKEMGRKLRCYNIKFDIYKNWGLNSNQAKQYKFDWKTKEKEKIAQIKTINKRYHKQYYKKEIVNNYHNSNLIVVSFYNNSTEPKLISEFQKVNRKLNYIIYKTNEDTNIPYILYELLKKLKKNILYVDINSKINKYYNYLNNTNMDFMCYNINNETSSKEPVCYDPKILKTLNLEILYLANNNIVLDFLLIWGKYNTKIFIDNDLQHKSLEYAFNISIALNKMRCFWLPKEIELPWKEKDTYKNLPLKIKQLTHNMEQCGIKESRKDNGNERKTHHKGSKKSPQKKSLYYSYFNF